ncbi:MAG: YHS domain-containing (seleno)protein [Hyphomicrobiales bacterium]
MPSFNRRQFLTLTTSAAIATSLGLFSSSAFAAKPEIFTGLVKGVAVAGYDPVAYFTMGKPVKGSAEHSLMHEGAEWRFSSADNKALFEANPAKYAPQYGGYCAYAVSQGYTAKGEPDVWKIVDDRLYLNFNRGVQRRWEKDVPSHISKADGNWPNVLTN